MSLPERGRPVSQQVARASWVAPDLSKEAERWWESEQL